MSNHLSDEATLKEVIDAINNLQDQLYIIRDTLHHGGYILQDGTAKKGE